MNLKYLIDNQFLESNKVTELFCNGKSVWKGLSDNLSNLKEDYDVVKFIREKDNSFNEAFYKIEVSSKKINESRLPKDKSIDPEFGLPEDKKYPLYDKDHVESAIKFFNYVERSKEKELADKIIHKMKEYNIPFDTIGDQNRLKKYIPETEKNDESLDLDENYKQSVRDGGEKTNSYLNGKEKAVFIAKARNNEFENKDFNTIKNQIQQIRNKVVQDYEKRTERRLKKQDEARVLTKDGDEVLDKDGKPFYTKTRAESAIKSGDLLKLKRKDGSFDTVVGTPENINKKEEDNYKLAKTKDESGEVIEAKHNKK